MGTREVESLRVTSLARADGRNLARVEVRLASLVPYQVFSKDKALNLVFERPASLVAAAEPAPAVAAPVPTAPAPAAPVSGPAPSASPATGPKASRIVAVSRDEIEGMLAFTVKADGRLSYRDFMLPNPDRLVVDFADVTARASVRSIDVGQNPVRKVRLGQFSADSPKVARLVLDLSGRAPYRIIDGTDGVRIVFGDGVEDAPAAHAPLAAMRAAEPQPLDPAAAPAATARPVAVEPLPLPPLPEPQTPAAPVESAQGPDLGSTGTACGVTGNLGTPISLDFKDGDLQDIFRLFSDISGLNVVVNPGVTGKVTLKLNEVPWGRALELILKTNWPRLRPRGERHPDREDHGPPEGGDRIVGSSRRRRSWPATCMTHTQRISYAKADDLSATS